jgi:hypothetical protein
MFSSRTPLAHRSTIRSSSRKTCRAGCLVFTKDPSARRRLWALLRGKLSHFAASSPAQEGRFLTCSRVCCLLQLKARRGWREDWSAQRRRRPPPPEVLQRPRVKLGGTPYAAATLANLDSNGWRCMYVTTRRPKESLWSRPTRHSSSNRMCHFNRTTSTTKVAGRLYLREDSTVATILCFIQTRYGTVLLATMILFLSTRHSCTRAVTRGCMKFTESHVSTDVFQAATCPSPRA